MSPDPVTDRDIYAWPMLSDGHTFTWTENIDQDLNFWFWLRREGGIGDDELGERIHRWAMREPNLARDHSQYPSYLSVGEAWREAEDRRDQLEFERPSPGVYQTHYREMEAVGIHIQVEWVMAPLGERWLIPPNLAALGVEGADGEGRLKAVLDAARALRKSRPNSSATSSIL
jgi:hypothetical protein